MNSPRATGKTRLTKSENASKTHKERERYVTALAAYSTAVTAGLTLVLAFLAALQVYAMISANNATVATQRAFVYVSDFKAAFDDSSNAGIQTVWTNSGETPTRDFTSYSGSSKLINIDNPEHLTNTFLKGLLRDRDVGKDGSPVSLIGPKASVESIFVPVSAAARAELATGHVMLFYGVARYRDIVSGKAHVTRYCKAINFVGANHIGFLDCRIGNCADGECESQGLP